MEQMVVNDFENTGEIYLKANGDGPFTITVRFKTEWKLSEIEKARYKPLLLRGDGTYIINAHAMDFLFDIYPKINEFGTMKPLISKVLKVLSMPPSNKRIGLLAEIRGRVRGIRKLRKGKTMWRRAINHSIEARDIQRQRSVMKLL